MNYEIIWRPAARADLHDLYDWIADRADARTAYGYTSRIEGHVAKLTAFPKRGTPRDDLSPGLRTSTFERRVIIAYRVEHNTVLVLRIIRAARDYAAFLKEP